MRNYFTFNLKGLSVSLPFFAILLVVYAYYFMKVVFFQSGNIFTADLVVDSSWFVLLLVWLLSVFVLLFVVWVAGFYVVKYSVAALSYKQAGFEPDYKLGEYVRFTVPGLLLSIITVGIYMPWLMNKTVKYFASHTTHNFSLLDFGGHAMTLFAFTVITNVLPMTVIALFMSSFRTSLETGDSMVIFWFVVMIVLSLFFSSLYSACVYGKWVLRFWYGNKRIVSTVSVWDGCMYIFGQSILMMITLGLYIPAAVLRINRYYIRSVAIGTEKIELRAGYEMRPWRDYFYVLLQGVLTIITLGFYLPWSYAKVNKRIINGIYVEQVEKPVEQMPLWE